LEPAAGSKNIKAKPHTFPGHTPHVRIALLKLMVQLSTVGIYNPLGRIFNGRADVDMFTAAVGRR
jgi:hypothetical protein